METHLVSKLYLSGVIPLIALWVVVRQSKPKLDTVPDQSGSILAFLLIALVAYEIFFGVIVKTFLHLNLIAMYLDDAPADFGLADPYTVCYGLTVFVLPLSVALLAFSLPLRSETKLSGRLSR